jgi:hypothetical protein
MAAENPAEQPDLSKANLIGADLNSASAGSFVDTSMFTAMKTLETSCRMLQRRLLVLPNPAGTSITDLNDSFTKRFPSPTFESGGSGLQALRSECLKHIPESARQR